MIITPVRNGKSHLLKIVSGLQGWFDHPDKNGKKQDNDFSYFLDTAQDGSTEMIKKK